MTFTVEMRRTVPRLASVRDDALLAAHVQRDGGLATATVRLPRREVDIVHTRSIGPHKATLRRGVLKADPAAICARPWSGQGAGISLGNITTTVD
jgi:hypothetical protein